MYENEEIENFINDSDDSVLDNSSDDSVIDEDLSLDIDIEESNDEASSATMVADLGEFDYSYLNTTNQYLGILIILFITFLSMYVFNQFRFYLQRSGL